jgi:hypothetical protein
MLIGFIDPSHDERKLDAPGRPPRWLTIDDLLGEALTQGPKWSPWSYELIQAVLSNIQNRDYFSTSMLTGGCYRGTVLERREDYVDSLDGNYASIKGTLIHRTLELAQRPGSLNEWRFFTDIDGLEFSCSPDVIQPDIGLLSDWKTTENPPNFGYAYRHHKEQVNLNRWVVNHATRWLDPQGSTDTPIPVDPRTIQFTQLSVVYLGPKEPKTILIEATREAKTPNGATIKRKVPDVWTDKAVRKFLDPRLEGLEMALASYPDWPEGLEEYPGFEGPAGWACAGPPYCYLPMCLGKRYPNGLVW